MALTLRACALREKISDSNIEGSGQLHDRRERRAPLAAENLRQVPFREIRLKIKAVERAVLLDDDRTQPSAEKSLLICHRARVAKAPRPGVCNCKRSATSGTISGRATRGEVSPSRATIATVAVNVSVQMP